MNENAIGTIVVDCVVELHRDRGPDLLETVCEATLARALERRGLRVHRQVGVSIEYLDPEPPFLGVSVREELIDGPPNAAPPRR